MHFNYTDAQFMCDFALHRERMIAVLPLNTQIAGKSVNAKPRKNKKPDRELSHDPGTCRGRFRLGTLELSAVLGGGLTDDLLKDPVEMG
jgi:hypothetical protein